MSSFKLNFRFFSLIFILAVALSALVARLFFLTVLDRSFLQQQGEARVLRVVNIPAHRGMITDRNGEPLAISTPVDSVWVNPQMFHATPDQVQALTQLLDLNVDDVNQRINNAGKREFIYLKRGVAPPIADEVKTLNIPGVFFQREYRRYYPLGEVAAQLLGFTNVDDQGQEGLELAYNSWLQGVPGKRLVLKDRLGHVIADVETVKPPDEGHDLVLSIDARIQYLAYRTLKEAVQRNSATWGSVVVLNPQTGEVLAVANVPSYNPNDRPDVHDDRFRNRAVTDMFEPGSTLKAFSIAAALQSGQYKPDTKVNTNPGWWVVGGHTIRDDGLNYGVVDVTQILQKSSNIGAAKLTLSLPPENLIGLLKQVGFGDRTDSGFPGESPGVLPVQQKWRPFDLATVAFGYGISVTALQLAHAYAVLADKGVRVPATFIKRAEVAKGIQAINPSVAEDMLAMLESVLQPGGTGRLAQVPGYRVAGKTGTAYIAGPGGYYKDRYIASFVGIAPVSHPQLVVAVIVYNPSPDSHFGGLVAAPAFARIMAGSLRILNIPPDNLS